jgi:hypothetical protein
LGCVMVRISCYCRYRVHAYSGSVACRDGYGAP